MIFGFGKLRGGQLDYWDLGFRSLGHWTCDVVYGWKFLGFHQRSSPKCPCTYEYIHQFYISEVRWGQHMLIIARQNNPVVYGSAVQRF